MSEQHSSTQHNLKKTLSSRLHSSFIILVFSVYLALSPDSVYVAEDCCGNSIVVVSSTCELIDMKKKHK